MSLSLQAIGLDGIGHAIPIICGPRLRKSAAQEARAVSCLPVAGVSLTSASAS